MEEELNLNIFTNVTKKICTCSFIAMVLILLFVLTPLSNLIKTSAIMKIISIILLIYTVYLNNIQTISLKNANMTNKSANVISQFNMNITCSYIFTMFLLLLTFFVIKSFF
jgi:hypothetical protein